MSMTQKDYKQIAESLRVLDNDPSTDSFTIACVRNALIHLFDWMYPTFDGGRFRAASTGDRKTYHEKEQA